MIKELVGIALRISVMYVYALALLRLSGKSSIGNLSPLDFVVAAILGDMFDNIFWSEIPLSQGLVGMGTVFIVHSLMRLATARLPALRRVLIGQPVTVMKDGVLVRAGMRKERTGENEVWAEIRAQGIAKEKAVEIRAATWEPDGSLAVILHKQDEPLQAGDVPQIVKPAQDSGGMR